jgi:hypothetical protein
VPKSSIDKAGMSIFERNARCYERRHHRNGDRPIVISPMIETKALAAARTPRHRDRQREPRVVIMTDKIRTDVPFGNVTESASLSRRMASTAMANTGTATRQAGKFAAMGEKDIISKQVIRHLAADVANYLLGLDIEPTSLELIETEQQRVEDRRADLVAQVRPRGAGPPYVLHIEIQNNNDSMMPWRMLRYLTDIRLRHTGLPVRQHLIYIGAAPLAMPAGLREPDLDYRYGLLDMHRVDCAALLVQDNPDALVLAILCDFGGREPQSVVDTIFLRLRELVGEDSRRLREYIDMIEVLSENRDLESNIKEAEKMLTQVDIERLPSYALGMERGLEKGEEQGMEQGIAIGSDRERLRLARNLLDLLGDELIAERTGLDWETVARLRKEVSED